MTDYFPQPATEPHGLFMHMHDHDWVEAGAKLNPNGTWSALFTCTLCPDVGVGGKVGPIPRGFCESCHWVQKKPGRKKCEECKARLDVAS